MRLTCTSCNKSVSNEVSDETVVRAVLICPECFQRDRQKLADAVTDVKLQLDGTRRPPVKGLVTHGLSSAIEKLIDLV
jgi:hypothetical protein